MTRGQRLLLLRTARGLTLDEVASKAGLTGAGIGGIEREQSKGRRGTMDAVATALSVSRDSLEDDAECFRELARLCGVALPNAAPTPEGELATLWQTVPPEQRQGLLTVLRGLVMTFAPRGR